MRRAVLALFLVGLLASPASAARAARVCTQEAQGPASVKSLIQCMAPRLDLSTSHALYIAWRESHYQPWARNPSSGSCGVFQHMPRYWPGRVGHWYYGPRVAERMSCYNGRTNVLVSLRMMRDGGYGPWGG